MAARRRPPATHSVRQPAAHRRNLCGNAVPFAAHSMRACCPIHRATSVRSSSLWSADHHATMCETASNSRPPSTASALLSRAKVRVGEGERRRGPRPESRHLRQPALEGLTNSARTETPRRGDRNKSDHVDGAHGGGTGRRKAAGGVSTCVTLNGSGIQLAVGPQPLRLRNHNFGLAHRIMVKRLATSPHDPIGITDSACKNQLVVVSVQYGPFNTYIPIRSTTIGKSRVAKDPITMYTSWRSNSDIASVTSIGYPRMRASGESSTTKHRILHASGPHPIPPPNDPKRVGKRVKVRRLSCRASMAFRVVRTNQYNQYLGLIHSTNGNHLESPNEGSSINHQVTIHLHAQNITMFPTNETWYFTSHMLVSDSGGLILILTAQYTRNVFRMHSDY
ncbi:hypothetical protein F511_38753 [Dorcoceras hygrometricum]|uniref:Uncharacterized protein n=1 Tax=Dorcoceras hygrometricum TaxID=472368 RepID=A0A2Z7CDC6_9LAMI|nr:hypothetical protein F511_38753 [Dorcoceras hygrometricum]